MLVQGSKSVLVFINFRGNILNLTIKLLDFAFNLLPLDGSSLSSLGCITCGLIIIFDKLNQFVVVLLKSHI